MYIKIFKPISWGKRPAERRSRVIQRFLKPRVHRDGTEACQKRDHGVLSAPQPRGKDAAERHGNITKAPCGCTVLLFQFDFTTDSMSSILISMVSQSCSLLPTSAINTLPPNASTIVASRPSFNRTVSYCFTSNYRTSEIYAVVILIFPSLAIHPTTTFAGFPVLPYSIIFCSYRTPYPLYPLFGTK